ncbi:MAG: hypothetical protein ACLRYY_10435 [Anaerobutyricum soehngenii]
MERSSACAVVGDLVYCYLLTIDGKAGRAPEADSHLIRQSGLPTKAFWKCGVTVEAAAKCASLCGER